MVLTRFVYDMFNTVFTTTPGYIAEVLLLCVAMYLCAPICRKKGDATYAKLSN